MICYGPTYLIDDNRRDGRVSAMLFVRDPQQPCCKGLDVQEFLGRNRDEADRRMADWIERNGAVEISEEALRTRGRFTPRPAATAGD